MGTDTLVTFSADLKFNLGQRSDLTSYLTGWVNDAYITLCGMKRFYDSKTRRYVKVYFPELEAVDTSKSTSDGTAYVTAPTACIFVRKIFDETNDTKLTAISLDKYLSYTDRDDTDAEGEPTEWVRMAEAATSGTRIMLHPTPDDTYSLYIYYRKRPTVLSGSNTTVLGAEWDLPITLLATYQSMMRLREYENAERFKEAWQDQMRELVGIYDEEKLDRDEIRKPKSSYGIRRDYK